MAGPARRSIALATHLGAVLPIELWYEGEPPDPIPNVTFRPYDIEAWLTASAGYAAALLPSQFALKEQRAFDASCIRIIDCTVPFPVETASILIGAPPHEQKQITRLQSWAINRAVSAGDYWLVSNQEQAHWIMGVMTSLGRMTPSFAQEFATESRIIPTPYGMDAPPDSPPDPAPRLALFAGLGLPPTTPYLLWTGGMWPWMDPLTVVEAMPLVLKEYPELHLLLPGAHSPHTAAPEQPQALAVRERIRALKLEQEVHLLDWISALDWPAIASGASLHVSAHSIHPETELSYRTRYLEALRWRKPLIVSPFDPLGGQLELVGFALSANAGAPEEYADAILEALERQPESPDIEAQRWAMIDQHFSWTTSLRVLADVIDAGLSPHPDGPWTPDLAGDPAAAPPTPTLLDRAKNKLRRMTR